MSAIAVPLAPSVDLPVLCDGETHTFTLPPADGWRGAQYRVNGKVVPGGQTYSTTGLPVIEEHRRTTVQVLAKSTVEGLPDLSMVAYLERKDALGPTEPAAEFDEDRGRRFRDLEAEYEYKRFMRSYEVVTREDWSLVQTFNLVVTEKVESPSPYLVPHRHLGDAITSQMATYQRTAFIVNLVETILTANGFGNDKSGKPKALTFSIYTHSRDKVEVYAASSRLFEVFTRGSYSDTIGKCLAAMAADKQLVERELNFFLAGRAQNLNAVAMAGKLATVKAMVHKIDSKQATASDKRDLLRFLDEQIARLKAMELPPDELDGPGNAPALA